MTTTTIKTIMPAGGGDYTSLNTWEAARRSNLIIGDKIEIAEVYSGGNAITGQLVLDSWNCDATHYIEVRAASGQEHSGTWSTSKAYMEASTGTIALRAARSIYLYVNKMQIKGNGGAIPVIHVGDGYLQVMNYNFDRCIIIRVNDTGTGGSAVFDVSNFYGVYGTVCKITNSIMLDIGSNNDHFGVRFADTGSLTVYNCTIVVKSGTGGNNSTFYKTGGTVTSQNCYLRSVTCYRSDGGPAYVKGANDATSTTEAVTTNLRSVPYSTATFLSVTDGSENLRPVVTAGNKLLDNGANLSGSGVTTDIIGTARPQFGAYDIGAFENDVPICWNYTAQYKNSNKLYKASGCGSFPKNIRVPGNVDKSSGRMVDDGELIDPNRYNIE